ncbi:MAG: alginate lyase family protein [Vicinamibacteria bacterium]
MSSLTRHAAAVFHLGPRQALRNLLHRARPSRRLDRYARASSSLVPSFRPAAAFLVHDMATRLRDGGFTAVGRTIDVGQPPDWHADGPLLWRFNLHYFAYLESATREEQGPLVLDWIERCPPRAGDPAWHPYPTSLRLRHWARWFAGGGGERLSAPERARVLASIEGQGDCLADTLERHLGANHLLENLLTLTILAAVFRGPAAERWGRVAGPLLADEIEEQFLPDGGHFERSPMYHAQLVLGLLDLLNVAGPDDAHARLVRERMPGLLRFLEALRHPDGRIALFNDSALGIAPDPEVLLDYAARLGFPPPARHGGSFPSSGYHVWRDGEDALVVDAGPIGPDYQPSHAHGDLFSYELSLGGRRVVVDGGTSTYEPGPERDAERSTLSHNTVSLDGEDQCEFFATFRVGRRGRPRDVTASVSGAGLHVAGWHDGYRRLPGRPVHHREMEMTPERALLVWDTVAPGGRHAAVSRVRFAPGSAVTIETPRRALVELEGLRLALRAFGGELTPEPGHYAPHFGARTPCPVLALHGTAGGEFGYALARLGGPIDIDAGGADVFGRRVDRRSRWSPGAGR